MKRLIILSSLLLPALSMNAQEINGGPVNVPADGIVDGVYITEHVPTKRMIPYEFVREADVTWSKRVWRTIDMREKINHPIYLPFDYHTPSGQYVRNSSRWSLWTILRHHIINGDLKVFSPYNPYQFDMLDGDQFKYMIAPEPGKNYYTDSIFRDKVFYYLGGLGPESDVPLTNEDGDPIEITLPDGSVTFKYPPRDTLWLDSKDIVQYRLKEDWFFDKERSVLDVRILGIAPVVYKIEVNATTGQKTIVGLEEKYWLYFPHCRYILNNYFVYNEQNDAQWMSFDDLFWKRQFNSTIYKESNVFDRKIDSYRTGVDALMESEKITEEIRLFEHDVWHF
ncbi:MAG: gliding motility protein GldN [Fluviicola sp.]|jgi:gliding motility associated protien GldN